MKDMNEICNNINESVAEIEKEEQKTLTESTLNESKYATEADKDVMIDMYDPVDEALKAMDKALEIARKIDDEKLFDRVNNAIGGAWDKLEKINKTMRKMKVK